jgi:hypothetical protein
MTRSGLDIGSRWCRANTCAHTPQSSGNVDMSKRKATKPAAKRRRKSGWDIDRRSIEAEWEAALLRIPEEILREEIAIWSWSDTPHGDLWCDMSVTLEDVLKDVGLDAKERKFVWPDAGRLDLDKSVRRINQQYPEFPEDQITEFLVFWIRSLYVPEGCSDSQMEELERLTERWVADLGMAEN